MALDSVAADSEMTSSTQRALLYIRTKSLSISAKYLCWLAHDSVAVDGEITRSEQRTAYIRTKSPIYITKSPCTYVHKEPYVPALFIRTKSRIYPRQKPCVSAKSAWCLSEDTSVLHDEWVMSHYEIIFSTHIGKSWHKRVSPDTQMKTWVMSHMKWVMSHMNESYHVWNKSVLTHK